MGRPLGHRVASGLAAGAASSALVGMASGVGLVLVPLAVILVVAAFAV